MSGSQRPFLILLAGLAAARGADETLLQHRGHNLMGAGRIAVQNFNEQACILGSAPSTHGMTRFEASAFAAITTFGGWPWLARCG